MTANDFEKLESGPYGTRWSFIYDENDSPPSVEVAERILGVKLAAYTHDASDEHDDGLCEEVYFAAEGFSQNAVETYKVQ